MKTYERITKCRELLGISQEVVAKYVRVAQASYSRVENGEIKRPRYFDQLAKLFKTTPVWLERGIGDAPSYWPDHHNIPPGTIPIILWNEFKDFYNDINYTFDLKQLEKLPYKYEGEDQLYAISFGPDQKKPFFYLVVNINAKAEIGHYVIAYSHQWDALMYGYLGEFNGKVCIMNPPIGKPGESVHDLEPEELTQEISIVAKVVNIVLPD